MRRRAFGRAALVGLLIAPLAAEAQPAGKPARVGILLLTTRSSGTAAVDHFRSELRELGYMEGQTIFFEYRAADGKVERLPELARELSAARVDVIYAPTAPAALAAKQATSATPVVFGGIPDPRGHGAGCEPGSARRERDRRGIEATPEQAAKQLELLKELAPSVTRVGIFGAPGLRQSLEAHQRIVEAAQARLAVAFVRVDVPTVADLDRAFDTLGRARVDALWLIAPAAFQGRGRIADYALENRLPAIAPHRESWTPAGLFPSARASPTAIGAPPPTSTGFSRGRSLEIYPSNSRRSSSW